MGLQRVRHKWATERRYKINLNFQSAKEVSGPYDFLWLEPIWSIWLDPIWWKHWPLFSLYLLRYNWSVWSLLTLTQHPQGCSCSHLVFLELGSYVLLRKSQNFALPPEMPHTLWPCYPNLRLLMTDSLNIAFPSSASMSIFKVLRCKQQK